MKIDIEEKDTDFSNLHAKLKKIENEKQEMIESLQKEIDQGQLSKEIELGAMKEQRDQQR